MKVSMNKVTLVSAAVAALFASAAQAQLAMTVSGANGTAIYASEARTPVTIINFAGTVATSLLGFGVASLNDRYIRFDLTNATFANAVLAGYLVNSVAFLNTAVVQGGAVGDNYVIFQVTGAATGHAASEVLTLTLVGNLSVAAIANVGLTYSLHETAVSANGPGPASNVTRLYNTTGQLVRFAPAVTITSTPVGVGMTETVAATQNFLQFCSGAAQVPGTAGCVSTSTDLRGIIGNIATYKLATVIPLDVATNAAVANLAVVAGATSSVTISGDLSAAATAVQTGDVAGAPACSAAAGTTVGLSATAANFTIGNTAYATTNTLCAIANGTGGLAAQSFTGSYKREAAAAPYATTGTTALGTTGQWVRDGAELQSPWFSFGGTRYVSRFFFMNTGSTAAACTATVLTEAGNTVTAGTLAGGFSVPANGQLAVLATDIAASATVAGRAAVRIACLAPSTNIQGRYVITDSVSGALDSGTMLRPGTN